MITEKNRAKILYYFRGNLSTHVHFFISWTNAVRDNGIPMELITFLKPGIYFKQYNLIKQFKSPSFHIYIDAPFSIFSVSYFFFTCLFNRKTIVHLKKRGTRLFDFLKSIFPNKLLYIIEGEGDCFSEKDYLEKHPYKQGFYDNLINGLNVECKEQRSLFEKADYLTFGYSSMKDLLASRYPDLNLEKKIILCPMSFKKGTFYFPPFEPAYIQLDSKKFYVLPHNYYK